MQFWVHSSIYEGETWSKKSVPEAFPPQQKADVLRQYELRLITQAAACQILRVSPATFFRYLKKLGEGGVEALKHGNTGKRPHNRMEESQRSRIVELISTKYCDFQPALICKYLLRDEGIDVSEEFIRRIVKAQDPVTRNVPLEEAHPLRRRRNRFGELIQIDGSPHHWFGNTNLGNLCTKGG